MSSANIPPAPAGPGVPKPYFCYECNRTVSIFPYSSPSDLACPICQGGFLEESQYPPNPNPSLFSSSSGDSLFPFGLPFFSVSPRDADLPSDLSAIFDSPSLRPRLSSFDLTEPNAFNPAHFLQNYLQTLAAEGASIQFILDGGPASSPLSASFGDYFIGPGLEQLIQQLMENDPNRYGTPPASNSAVESLPDIKISPELLESDSAQCAVCKETFELESDAKRMPCKHIYHPDCILPWLALHNSCPVCRYELPTDDPDYEHRMRGTPLQANATSGNADSEMGGSSGEEARGDPARTVERRFRISLPWPFMASGSPAETSSTSSAGDNTVNDDERETNSNPSHRGNQDMGSETRQEDLD